MDPRLQEMLDHYEIRKALSEYCHGCDRCDDQRMGGAYTEDSWDDHGKWQAPGPEFARDMVVEILAVSDTLSHMLGQSLIKVDGDEAGAETYFFSVAMRTREDGLSFCDQLGGRFVDRFVRTAEGWKIKHRVAIRDWSIGLPVVNDFVGALSLHDGHRSNADPSFAALGITHSGTHKSNSNPTH